MVRFDGDHGEYRIVCGEGRTMKGPYTKNTYVWLKVREWRRWERIFIQGPYIHHVACIYGRYAPVIAEAVKYLPGEIALDLADGKPEEIMDRLTSDS